jgi:DNA-binding IclR family transcriptional regulator
MLIRVYRIVASIWRQRLVKRWKFELENREECSLWSLGMKLIEACEHYEENLNYEVAKLAMDLLLAELSRRDAERHDLMIWKANRAEYIARQNEILEEIEAERASFDAGMDALWLAEIEPEGEA